MSFFSLLIIGLRFLLEIITVLGIFIGGLKQSIFLKLLFILISISITILWYFFGAPKSPYVLSGIDKLILELFVYFIGIISFYYLFDFKIASTYTIIAIFNIIMIYFLNL